jgi:hypothetical protein
VDVVDKKGMTTLHHAIALNAIKPAKEIILMVPEKKIGKSPEKILFYSFGTRF